MMIMLAPESTLKDAVRDHWNTRSCGEVYANGDSRREMLAAQAHRRYELEPYLPEFARFAQGRGKDVLEVGVGMGADHLEWAKSRPRSLTGIDLTPRAVEFTRARFREAGFKSKLSVGDAENLPFSDNSFDLVYSWGVLHHSPDTLGAISEVHRVLRPGGQARIMIYHKYSLVGYMLWMRYGLLAGRPGRPLAEIYAEHLESPGTKAYTLEEAQDMFAPFQQVDARSQLSFGDLLEGEVGQNHRGMVLTTAKALWPRWLLRRACASHGLMLLVDAVK